MRPLSRFMPVALSALLLLLALVVVGAGWRDHGPSETARAQPSTPARTVPAPPPARTVPTPPPASTPARGGSTTPQPPAPPATPHCTTSDLSASMAPGSPGAGQRSATLVLTNISGRACQTYGYPGLGLVGADGATLPSHVIWGGPGDPGRSTVQLAAGGTASAAMSWSAMPGTGDAATGPCQPAAATLLVTPPDERESLHVPFGQSVCEGGRITVTALVGGSRGPA